MKNIKRSKIKNIVLAITFIITLSSCSTAKNLANEITSYKNSVSTELNEETVQTGLVAKEELAEIKEEESKEVSKTEESETENSTYLADSDQAMEENQAKESENKESDQEADDSEKPSEKLEANGATEENEKPATKILEEKEEESEVKVVEEVNEILYYIVEYDHVKKEYYNNEEGLREVINDGLADIEALDFLEERQKANLKEQLQSQKSVEEAINFMAAVRANKFDEYIHPADGNEVYSRVQVTKVISGDTIEILLDGQRKKVKLTGIKAPDKDSQRFGKEAYEFCKESLEGKYVFVETASVKAENTSSLVWLALPRNNTKVTFDELANQTINGILTKEGYANPTEGKFAQHFEKMQEEAMSANAGMWY